MNEFAFFIISGFDSVRDFFELGGDVLLLVAAVTLLMWGLIFDHLIYMQFAHQRLVRQTIALWDLRSDRESWFALSIREQLVSVLASGLEKRLPMIKACVMVCPLLGLLGTVTGMVEVFQVMAMSGSGNPRSMAAGISKATIPTLAGMVSALSGLAVSAYLQNKAQRERLILGERIQMSHGEIKVDYA